jgi:type IV secretion system protein VirB1
MDFDAVAARCAPSVSPSTLRAIASVESSLNPYANGVVGGALQRQPKTLLEGIATVTALRANKSRFSAGIAQIYIGNWAAHGLTAQTVFDPCLNLRAAAEILTDCHTRATRISHDPQAALRKALSCYYANNFTTGFTDGYVQRVVVTALRNGADAKPPAAYNMPAK